MSQTFTIPGQSGGTNLRYYVFTTTLSSGDLSGNSFRTDLATIAFNNSGGINFSILFPVEYTHFTARPKGRTIDLSFGTATEQNNDYFEVQRSADNRTWEVLGQLAGAGTTGTPQQYAFTDRTPRAGSNYYRLRQVDYDGSFEYSKTVVAELETLEEDITIFPNPVSDQLTIRFTAQQTAKELVLLALDGKELLRQNWSDCIDCQSVTVRLPELPSGLYQAVFFDGAGQVVRQQPVTIQ